MIQTREKSRRFGNFTYREIRDCAEQGWLVVIPTGCTEQQGPHLPVDFDTWFAESLMVAAAEKAAQDHAVQALVLPAMPFGPTPEHRHFGSGCIDLPLALHHALIEAILSSLVAQGFQRMILWRGCGGHDLAEVVERFNHMNHGKARAFLPSHPFHEIWCRVADPYGSGRDMLIALPPPFRSTCDQNQYDKIRFGTHIPQQLIGLIPIWILLAPLRQA